MNSLSPASVDVDSAAVFACANSLWEACRDAASQDRTVNLSDAYNGFDQLMREVMSIGELFENWACRNVAFDSLNDVWPYLLEDRFGKAATSMVGLTSLASFDEIDCLRVALDMRVPLYFSEAARMPLDVCAVNPISNSEFRQFRIQTVRQHFGDGCIEVYGFDGDPIDDEFGDPYIAWYGVDGGGLVEHIRDFDAYSAAIIFIRKLVPGISFPEKPVIGGELHQIENR